MCKSHIALACALAFPLHAAFAAGVESLTVANTAQSSTPPSKKLGGVTVTRGQPTSLPTQIPTTSEGVTREQITHSINATDSEDALKYPPGNGATT